MQGWIFAKARKPRFVIYADADIAAELVEMLVEKIVKIAEAFCAVVNVDVARLKAHALMLGKLDAVLIEYLNQFVRCARFGLVDAVFKTMERWLADTR